MHTATKKLKKKPPTSNSRPSAPEIPNRKPEPTRNFVLLCRSFELCVNQSTTATDGKIPIRGRKKSFGNPRLKTLAPKMVAIPKAMPVHLEQR